MTGGAAAIATLPDEQAAVAVVSAYASALDARNWRAFRALFDEEVAIDYGAIGSLVATVGADAWTDRCRALEGFDATAHRVRDPVVTLDGAAATVTSIVDAAHFVTPDDQGEGAAPEGPVLMGDLIGRYVHRLRRRDGRWRIAAVTLTVVGYPAGKPAFDAAFVAARARFAGKSA